MRIAYFTAGTVGAGHLVRGLAIRRGLERAGVKAEMRIFSPPLQFAVRAEGVEAVTLVRGDLLERERAAGSAVALALRGFRPEVLVVDMFWAPLRFVLPLEGCAAWLLVRTAPAQWMKGPEGAPFDRSQYARVIGIEPLPEEAAADEAIDPIVICNPDECRPPGALRELLGVPAGRPLALVVHAGREGEHELLTARARLTAQGHEIVGADLFARDAIFPVAPYLPGAERIVGGGGYNLFWETRWLDLAERAQLFPLPRNIDDQHWRLSAGPAHHMRENGADALARMLASG